jgi:hypothetical protein
VTKLGLRPYVIGDDPPLRSVPVSVVILSRDEEVNIRRCLSSVAWADQTVVIDSGSTDDTVTIARASGAEIVEQPWLGFSGQREFALRLPLLRHDWVYFVDADQWISPQLAAEVSEKLKNPSCAAFSQRGRFIFQGKWIRHCGWYTASRNVQLMDRRCTKYDGSLVGERACVDGPIHSLRNDLVDEDLKGLAAWLHKHVRYAQLEAQRRGQPTPLPQRIRKLRSRDRTNAKPLARLILKNVIFPSVPAKPVALFTYMYFVRLGFLDGWAGLRFCFYRAWHEANVAALRTDVPTARGRAISWTRA